MNTSPNDESVILAKLLPDLQRLQHDSRGRLQWIATLTDQQRVVLMHWAQQRMPSLLSEIQRVPAVPPPRRRRVGRNWR